ncbi:MAG: HAD family hydrolase [Candidatus Sericytochromatia bacterium]
MKAQNLIIDLDNTIYSTYSIGETLFKPIFDLIEKDKGFNSNIENIKKDIMRKPFQKVALEYNFSENLTKEGIEVLSSLDADLKMSVFEDYKYIKNLTCKKFLVTMGFLKMQEGKIKSLGISKDFHEIYIIDPQVSQKTKKDVFLDIIEKYNLHKDDLVIVGDDPNSEIKAGIDLEIQTFLYDKLKTNSHRTDLNRIENFKQLLDYII